MLAEAIVYFIGLWIPIMAISHELCHALECKRQGGNPKIKIWWHNKIPSMHCSCDKITNDKLFYFAGGVYNAGFLFAISTLLSSINQPLSDTLLVYAMIQLSYGTYEGIYIEKLSTAMYMKFKNYAYAIGSILGLILVWLKRRK